MTVDDCFQKQGSLLVSENPGMVLKYFEEHGKRNIVLMHGLAYLSPSTVRAALDRYAEPNEYFYCSETRTYLHAAVLAFRAFERKEEFAHAICLIRILHELMEAGMRPERPIQYIKDPDHKGKKIWDCTTVKEYALSWANQNADIPHLPGSIKKMFI